MRRLLPLFICLTLRAAAPTWEAGNAFAVTYRNWVVLRNARVNSTATGGTLSMPEMLAWRKVQGAWRQLEASVGTEYRGGR